MTSSSSKLSSAYKVQSEHASRFPHNYYTTPLTSPPSAPHLPPSQRRYYFLDVRPPPSVPVKITLLLLHGFPDSSYGWRNVLSPLSLSGYRCIVPDLVGYGRTTKPLRLEGYGAHSQALDLAGLMTFAMGSDEARFAVVGHDWGSWLSWKLANWIPERLLGVHGICIPYAAPSSKYVSVQDLAKMLPPYEYQTFFEDARSTSIIQKNLDSFLYRIYASPSLVKAAPQLARKMGFVQAGLLEKSLEEGSTDLSLLAKVAPLDSDDLQMLHLLFDENKGGGMDGPLNWYRTRRVNHEEDQALKDRKLPPLPYKMLVPDLDPTAPMFLTEKAGTFVSKGGVYRVESVKNCGHWVLLEYPEVASNSIMRWLQEDVLPRQASLLEKIQSKL
ncbi:hypothetical protein CBS101457_003358 [Exobasidium rhododendri]|nr:hypothetical protein CBS101457_003358 [Exobasidium rhododendri]